MDLGEGGGGRKQRIFWGFGSRLVENGRQSSGPFNLMRIVLPGEASVLPEKLHAGAMKIVAVGFRSYPILRDFTALSFVTAIMKLKEQSGRGGVKKRPNFFALSPTSHHHPPTPIMKVSHLPSLNVVPTTGGRCIEMGRYFRVFIGVSWRGSGWWWTSSSRLADRKAKRGWGR